MNWLGHQVQQHVSIFDTVLDLGCGIMQATGGLQAKSILGVDLVDAYLDQIKPHVATVKLSMQELARFVDGSYDVVICLDVVEHLEKTDAIAAIDHMKRIARKKVILYTPNEFHSNADAVDNAWDLGPNDLQLHRCLISNTELTALDFLVSNENRDAGNFAIWKK